MRIGVAAPSSGPYAALGAQILAGARSVAGNAEIVSADTQCSAEGGMQAAEQFVRDRAAIAVGFLCTAALHAALPILKGANIPALDVGVRADRILTRRERDGTLVWRIAPASSAEAEAIARFVRTRWSGAAFAIVEDGSSYGRDLADTVRARLEEDGLRPSFVDNYRPAEEKQFALARRIGQSGVTRVLVFGTRGDIAVIARDAAASDLGLTIAGGESLLDESTGQVPLAPGIIAVASGFDVDWTPSETAPPLEGYGTAAAVATEVAVEALRRSRSSGGSIADILNTDSFDTSRGALRFDGTGQADLATFRPYRWDGARFLADGEG